MGKIRTDRLLKLADFLETVPPAQFNISDWQTQAPNKPEGKKQGECGFAGCAVGWAAHAKLFRGLKLTHTTIGADTTYQDESGFRAAAKLFGFSLDSSLPEQAEYLFASWRYPMRPVKARDVAKRIRQFVADPSKAPSS